MQQSDIYNESEHLISWRHLLTFTTGFPSKEPVHGDFV